MFDNHSPAKAGIIFRGGGLKGPELAALNLGSRRKLLKGHVGVMGAFSVREGRLVR